MKNLKKFFFLFSVVFVFVLSKLQVGGKVYYSDSASGTTDISLATKFNELKDCYTIQVNSKEDWYIETIS